MPAPDRPPPSPLWPLSLGAAALAGAVAAVGCAGVIEEPPTDDVAPVIATAALKRLTPVQYAAAIHSIFGPDLTVPTALDPVQSLEGFLAVGAATAAVSERGVRQYETAAYTIAEQVMAPGPGRDAAIGCTPTGVTDDACAGAYLARIGRLAFRRPLTTDEVATWVGVSSNAATTLGDFHQGLAFGVAGVLQSPHFLFRMEGLAEGEAERPYDDFQMATRLAFFLWNSPPDDALIGAAERGELTDDASLARHVDAMLESPRVEQGLRNFFIERFEFYRLFKEGKDTNEYPAATSDLPAYAREETLLTLTDLLLHQAGDYRTVFTTRRTHVNRALAALYGVPAPALEGFNPVELPADGPRRGLLGHVSILGNFSHANASSATQRGRFVRSVLLCGRIPEPPAMVPSLPEPEGELITLRDRLEPHRENAVCASCHSVMDPIGLGLEQFDGLGQYRLTETERVDPASGRVPKEKAIDPADTLDGVPFADAAGLGEVIAQHPDLGPCLTRHLYRYATGTIAGEPAAVATLSSVLVEAEYRIKPVLRALALSPAFRRAGASTEEP